MTDEVKRICRRWVALSAVGAIIGFVLVYGLWPKSADGLTVAALPVAAVALAQAVALYRTRPAPVLALLWLAVTPAFIVAANILGLVGFSGWRHVPSYLEYATVLSMVTTPVLLSSRLYPGCDPEEVAWPRARLRADHRGRQCRGAHLRAPARMALGERGADGSSGRDRLSASAGAPLMFVLSAFQAISLKNVALHTEPFRRMA